MSAATTTAINGQPVEFAGVPVKLGRCWYVLPALNAGALRRHATAIKAVQSSEPDEQIATCSLLVYEALRRNYPHVTAEFVEDRVDMGNFQHLLEITMGISGLELVDHVAAEAGNAPGQPATGLPSTPTSPPASAGPTATSTD